MSEKHSPLRCHPCLHIASKVSSKNTAKTWACVSHIYKAFSAAVMLLLNLPCRFFFHHFPGRSTLNLISVLFIGEEIKTNIVSPVCSNYCSTRLSWGSYLRPPRWRRSLFQSAACIGSLGYPLGSQYVQSLSKKKKTFLASSKWNNICISTNCLVSCYSTAVVLHIYP